MYSSYSGRIQWRAVNPFFKLYLALHCPRRAVLFDPFCEARQQVMATLIQW
jgi:hypothetical protein